MRSTESTLSRIYGVHARTLELLNARGLADELVATGHRVQVMDVFGSAKLNYGILRSETRFAFLLITPHNHVERLLKRRADSAGSPPFVPHTISPGESASHFLTDPGAQDSGVTWMSLPTRPSPAAGS